MKIKHSVLSGAIILSVAGLICKALGAVSKIPLSNILTGEGLGIYQLIFPLYSLLLLISSSGIPIAISKIISENKTIAIKITKYALKLILILAIILSVAVFLLSNFIAKLQGNQMATWAYIIISPAILLVAIISVIRGYFQGLQNFTPTAISQIIEQVTKVVISICLAIIFKPFGILYSVIGAVAGITLSELIAFVYLLYFYKKEIRNTVIQDNKTFNQKEMRKVLIKTAFPITVASIILPILSLVDSVMFMQGLQSWNYSTNIVTSMYGVESGVVSSLLNFPLVVSTSLSSCLIPLISSNVNSEKNCCIAFKIQTYIIIPITTFYMFFSKQILSFLFGGALSSAEFNLFNYANTMLVFTSVSMLYIGVMQISTAILQAKNKLWYPIIIYLIGGLIKIILNLILLKVAHVNIFAVSISSVAMYFIIAVLLLIKVKQLQNFKLNYVKNILFPIAIVTIISSLVSININSNFLALIMGGIVFVLIPYAIMLITGFFEKNELSFLPFKKTQINQ